MKKNVLFTSFTSILFSFSAVAVDVSTAIKVGNDSNPFLLSEQYSPNNANFIATKIYVSHKFKSGFSLRGNWLNNNYETNFDAADKDKFSLGAAFKSKGELLNKKVSYKLDAQFENLDKTYVSRAKGEIGTIGGITVADRYDYNMLAAEADLTFHWSKHIDFGFTFDIRAKEYEDYTNIGASNLNYTHASLKTDIKYKANNEHSFSAYYRFRNRVYEDRLGKDLLGNSIDGTELEYEYHMSQFTWDFDISKKHDLQAYVYLEKRNDNVAGYYDTTWQRARIRYQNKISKNQKLKVYLTYKDYSYDINGKLASIEGEDPLNSKKGVQFEVAYGYKMGKLAGLRWSFDTSFTYEDYDNVDPRYAYDRTLGYLGIKVKL